MKTLTLVLAALALSSFSIGCTGSSDSTATTETQTGDDSHAGHDHDAHAGHDHEGHDHSAADHTPKHGGQLIELGRNHEYHAEVVDDHETESVTVYIMDGHLEPLAINQSAVTLILTAGDKTESYELLANQPGGSSEFESSDKSLMEMIDLDKTQGKLRVTIKDKPFSGVFGPHAH